MDQDDVQLQESSQFEKLESNDEYSELFANDENKGMDIRQVEEHETATKIKTIKYV